MQFAVIGLGDFGSRVAIALTELGGEVIAIDKDEDIIERLKDKVSQAVVADATEERALRSIGVHDVDTAVVCVGEMDASIMTTVVLRRIGVSKIVARALSEVHKRVLDEVGASRIIHMEQQMADQLAEQLMAPQVMEHVTFPGGYTLVEIKANKDFLNKTIAELELRKKHGVNIVAIQKRQPDVDESGKSYIKETTNTHPQPNDIIEEDDVLVLVGGTGHIEAFLEQHAT